MTLAAPYMLFGLLAVPLAAFSYWLLERQRARRSAAWSRRAMLPNIVRRPSPRVRYLPGAFFLLGLTFFLLGAARPERTLGDVPGAAATVALTFDVSGSMAATDAYPTRIMAAHNAAIKFLNVLPARYRVAVVTFGDKVHLVLAPTFDRKKVIANLPTAITPRAGTAIGDAISFSVAVIVGAVGTSDPRDVYRPGAVLLLSDGGQTAGGVTPEEAAVSALGDDVPVDAISIGTPTGIVTQRVNVGGFQTSTRIPVPVDSDTLREVSQQTGGTLFSAASVAKSPATLRKVYEDLGSNAAPGHRMHELSAATAAVALVFILAGIVLRGLWFGKVP